MQNDKPVGAGRLHGHPLYGRFDTKEEVDAFLKQHDIPFKRSAAWSGRDGEGVHKWVLKCCPWNPDHTDGAAYILLFKKGNIAVGCHHNGCQGKGASEFLDIYEPGWRDQISQSPKMKTRIHGSSSYRGPDAVNTQTPDRPPEAVQLWGFEKPAKMVSFLKGLLWEGFVTLLAADGGTGKSYLAIFLSIMVVLGRPFLGIRTTRGRVLYVDYELDETEQKRRVWRVLAGLGMTPDDERLRDRFFYYRPRFALSTDAGHDEVIALVEQHDIDLVILDSLSIGLGADATSQQDVTRIMQRFKEWRTVLAIDHISAQAARGNQSQARPFGSVFKRNIARSTLTLGKADGGGYLLTPDKSNFGPQEEMICYDMQFDDDGERVVFECLALTDDAMAGALKNMKTHDITFKAIQELFSENGRSVMPSEISVWREENEVPIGKGTVRNHLTVLNKRGHIEYLGDGSVCPSGHDVTAPKGEVNREGAPAKPKKRIPNLEYPDEMPIGKLPW